MQIYQTHFQQLVDEKVMCCVANSKKTKLGSCGWECVQPNHIVMLGVHILYVLSNLHSKKISMDAGTQAINKITRMIQY